MLDFFEFVNNFDCFFLFETMVVKEKINDYSNYFRCFDLHWIPAHKPIRGRPSEGLVCGIKKVNSVMPKTEVIKLNERIIVQLELSSVKYYIIPVYLNFEKWEAVFMEMQNFLVDFNKENIVLIGDFNARISNKQVLEDTMGEYFMGLEIIRKSRDEKSDGRGVKFLDFCSENGFTVLNGRTKSDRGGEFTFVSQNGCSVIDLCCVSGNWLKYITDFEVISKPYTKHMPISVTLNIGELSEARENNLPPRIFWVDSKKELYNRRLDILVENWEEIEEVTSLNNRLIDLIKSASGSQNSKLLTKKQKWFDFKCNALRKKVFALLNLFRESNLPQIKKMYLKVNNEYKSVCRKKRQQYYSNMANRLVQVKDSRSFWCVIRELKGCRNVCGTQLNVEQLASYFSTQLNPPLTAPSIQFALAYREDTKLDAVVTLEELKNVLARLKNNKAPGSDRIGYEFFKGASDIFLNKVVYLFNLIMVKKEVPDAFKKTIISPLYKKGNVNDPSNYRAISLTDAIAKIFSGILLQRLISFIEEYKLLSECQAGFRPGYSTIDHIFTVTNVIKLYKIRKKKLYAFFIDLKSAFDWIDRNALIYKLNEFGLSYQFISIIRDLYRDTRACVWNGNILSEDFQTVMGLKQGCLLSPILFALFIDDVTKILPGGINIAGLIIKILLYADDMVIFAETSESLQLMINKIGEYFDRWNLSVNLEKSKIMVFRGGGRLASTEKWFFKRQKIEVVKEYKYLGVVLTPHMSWSNHMNQKYSQAAMALNLTWWSVLGNQNIAHSVKYNIFNTVMRSIMCYAAQVWGYEYFDTVEKLQRFFIKKTYWIPSNAPNYMLYVETGLAPIFLYTFKLHIDYICKIMQYGGNRIPRKLAEVILNKRVLYVKEWHDLGEKHDTALDVRIDNLEEWRGQLYSLVEKMDNEFRKNFVASARNSMHRNIYNELNYDLGDNNYFNDKYSIKTISSICKARGELLSLQYTPHKESGTTICNLCNTDQMEDVVHFLAACPMLREIRRVHFHKDNLSHFEAMEYLNGKDWIKLSEYITEAYKYRKKIIAGDF